MTKFDRYQELMIHWTRDIVLVIPDGSMSSDVYSEDECRFYTEIFSGFCEIVDVVNTLELSLKLIKTSPPRSKKITKDEYLKYLVGCYLQEVYILKERLKTYATKIMRRYKKIKNDSLLDEKFAPIFDFIKKSLSGIVETRGEHVHKRRFSDDSLNLLSHLSFVSRYNDRFNDDADIAYIKAKSKWQKQVKTNNDEIHKILDIYFDFLYGVVTKNDELIVPNNLFVKSCSA